MDRLLVVATIGSIRTASHQELPWWDIDELELRILRDACPAVEPSQHQEQYELAGP